MAKCSFSCCVVLCLSAGAAFAEAATPPRSLGSPANATDNCYRLHSREGEVAGEAQVTVSVSAAGRVTGATSAPGTPEPLASAAQCVAVTMRFEPAREDGQPVAGKLTVAIGFPTPPQLRVDLVRATTYCQPAVQPLTTLNSAYEGTARPAGQGGQGRARCGDRAAGGRAAVDGGSGALPEGSSRLLSRAAQSRGGGVLDDGADRLQLDAQRARARAAGRAHHPLGRRADPLRVSRVLSGRPQRRGQGELPHHRDGRRARAGKRKSFRRAATRHSTRRVSASCSNWCSCRRAATESTSRQP